MLRVLVEIHPFGVASAKRTIARLDIANVSELAEHSDYTVEANLDGTERRAVVFQHRRALGWIPLVRRVLEALEKGG